MGKIEEESKQVKEEAAAFEKEITVLKIAEKKWEEAGKNAVHEEAHKELVELREQREKEVADLQEKTQKKWAACEKVEGQVENLKVTRVKLAEEIEVRKQQLKDDHERAEMEAVAMTSAAMDAELAGRKEEELAAELLEQKKQLQKEVKETEKAVEKRRILLKPLDEAKLKAAEAQLEKATKEYKEIEQQDASLKLEIRHMKRKIEEFEKQIKEKAEAEAAVEAEK